MRRGISKTWPEIQKAHPIPQALFQGQTGIIKFNFLYVTEILPEILFLI